MRSLGCNYNRQILTTIATTTTNTTTPHHHTKQKLVDVVAVTVDTPAANRKLAKKSRIQFPVLSDEAREWMLAYRVTQGGLRDNMAFLIEPDLGRVSEL